MSFPASKEKIIAGKRNAKINSVARYESFLGKPNEALQPTPGSNVIETEKVVTAQALLSLVSRFQEYIINKGDLSDKQ
jgi:hypothetical protein